MTYTDTQLQQALAKMLPDAIHFTPSVGLIWNKSDLALGYVLDTELLHLCWMVEATLTVERKREFIGVIWDKFVERVDVPNDRYYQALHATWQQRTIALAKVKGIEIV